MLSERVIFETAMTLLDLKNSVGATAHTFLSICVFASFLANSVNIADVFVECEIWCILTNLFGTYFFGIFE